jgi:hypothetical protein
LRSEFNYTFTTPRREDPRVTGSETVAPGGARTRRLPRAALAVAGLVVLSTAVRFAAAQAFTTPWIAPDEMVYGLIGETLWSEGTLTVRGLPTPYYSLLTPILVGAPLAALDLAEGIQWARLLQALAASLVAVPTYRWARRLVPDGWAVAAAALTLLAPALHYAGFLMTEPLTLTVVTAALLALARAIEEPSTWRYGIFAGWATAAAAVRLQALVLLPAFLLAVALDALAARDRARLRPLLGLAAAAGVVLVAIAVVIVVRGDEISAESVLGAYTPVGASTGSAVDTGGLVEVAWHAFDVAVLGLGIPVLAIAALALGVFSGHDGDAALRAFVSVAFAYGLLLVAQVGLFSAEYVGHVAERYLITLLPLLAIGLCAWIARGAPRALAVVIPIWLLLVIASALVPLSEIASAGTLVNALTPSPLTGLTADQARITLVAGALAAGALVVLLPRRFAWTTAVVVGVGLALVSVDTRQRIADASEHEDRVAMGSAPPSWVDEAGLTDATLLVTGDRLWTSVARTFFWNRAIREVLRLAPATLPFPPSTPTVEAGDDGVLRTPDGKPISRDVVVTPSTITLAGEKLAERPVGDSEAYGLTAWRPATPTRMLLRVDGLLPNGDFTGNARMTVFDCRPGTLDVTILGKTGDPIRAYVDGFEVATLETPAEDAATHRIPAPPYANGKRPCIFDLENPGFAGTTTIVFSPRAGS